MDSSVGGAASDTMGGDTELTVMLGLVYLIVFALAPVLSIVATVKLYRKIGVSPLVIFVPIYNLYVFFKAFGVRRWFWALILCFGAFCAVAYCMSNSLIAEEIATYALLCVLYGIFGLVSAVGSLYYTYNMACSFGKGFGFFVGLWVCTPLFYLILAFGKADYVGAPN